MTSAKLGTGKTPGPSLRHRLANRLRQDNTGGILLAVTAVVALVWVNSPLQDSYEALRHWTFGPASLGLNLAFENWAADGLLTLFFFVVGLELKREFVTGELRSLRKATLPVVAALGGMACPALIYLAINLTRPGGAHQGWAVPVATDIAFSVAVMGLVSGHIPRSLRVFLLTLAVADDLLGITVIALFYNTGGLELAWLGGCLVAVAAFGVAVQRHWTKVWLLLPLALVAWYCMHHSGIHATIAGVLLGFTVPAKTRHDYHKSLSERLSYKLSPLTFGLVVPLFALMTAGVSVNSGALAAAVKDPVAQGISLGLVLGKPLGILAATWLMVKLTKARLDPQLGWFDILAMGEIAGIGFTVSLLINQLAFADQSGQTDHGTMAVLAGSLFAALAGAALMAWRNSVHRRRGIVQ